MMGLFLLAQFGGYETPLNFLEDLFYSVYPVIYFSAAVIFAAITILEKWVFAFHPL